MKTTARNTLMMNLALAMTSALLVGCNNGSKGDNNNTNGQIAGVNYTGFQVGQLGVGNQTCYFVTNNSYKCEETYFSNGQRLATQIVSFNSQIELCNNLRNDNLNSVSVSAGFPFAIASSVRNSYVNANCNGIQNNFPNQNGTIQTGNLLKNMNCRLMVEAADGAVGDSGDMQVPIAASGSSNGFYAIMDRVRQGSIFTTVRKFQSTRYMDANFRYIPSRSGEADQLELIIKTKSDKKQTGQFASITGFAGQAVSLTVDNSGDVVRAEFTCTVTDSSNRGLSKSNTDVTCKISGTDEDLEKDNLTISQSDLNSGTTLGFTGERSQNSVTLGAEGSSALYTSGHNSGRISTQFTGKANLNTRTIFKTRTVTKDVTVNCR